MNKEKTIRISTGIALAALLVFFPSALFAASAAKKPTAQPKALPPAPFEVSGWIPYWRTATGTADALAHVDALKEINPFGYTVKTDGELYDAMHVAEEPWQTLIATAREKKVRVIPTVMWSNTNAIDAVLKSPKLRKAHIKQIVQAVTERGFDGIDIDYEGKKADTKKYFALFLRDLYKAMGKKWVVCTIEARTPLESRFKKIPPGIRYANDFVAINKYCDRVRIMTYDQGAIDLTLNEAAPGPYIPVADPLWVEKVIALTAETIAKKKLVIGVATYGYEFAVTSIPEGYEYKLKWAFNPRYAVELAQALHITPERNSAGELSFSYTPTSTPALPTPEEAIRTNLLANALAATTSTSTVTVTATATAGAATSTAPFRLVWWSDANAIKDKIALAKKLGVRGVAIFKIDGGEDPAMWRVVKQ